MTFLGPDFVTAVFLGLGVIAAGAVALTLVHIIVKGDNL